MEIFAPYWIQVLDAWPLSERALFVLSIVLMNWTIFLLPAWIQYACLESALFSKYKINKDDPPPDIMAACAKRTTIGSVVMTPLFMYLLYPLFKKCGMQADVASLPSVSRFLGQLLAFTVINDFWFYWFHRLLHHPKLYWIHKRHHAFHNSSIIFAAMYAHGIEGLLTGLIPVFMGPLFAGAHLATVSAWYGLRVWEGVQAHCGLQFPFSGLGAWGLGWPLPLINNNEWHDYHHTNNNGNYGVEIMDWAFGTDKKFRVWKKAKEAKKMEQERGVPGLVTEDKKLK